MVVTFYLSQAQIQGFDFYIILYYEGGWETPWKNIESIPILAYSNNKWEHKYYFSITRCLSESDSQQYVNFESCEKKLINILET